MKKSLLLLLCLSVSCFLIAQNSVKQKEIGLVFSNLDNFGFSIKTGTDKSLWRFNTLLLSGANIDYSADSSVNKQNNMGFGIKVGKEYRKLISETLELRFGADLSFTYFKAKSDYNDKTVINNDRLSEQTTYSSGINLVVGVNYIISDNFVIGAEILPNFSYTTGRSTQKSKYGNFENEFKSDVSGFNYGLSNTSALLSLVCRF